MHHGLSCVKGGLWHLRDKRHNKIRDILYKWMQKRGIQVNREVPLNAFGARGQPSTQSCYTNNQLNGRDRTPAQGGGGTLSRRGSLPVRSAGRMYDVLISRSRSVEDVMDLMVNWGVTNIMIDVSIVNPLTASKLEQTSKEILAAAKMKTLEKVVKYKSFEDGTKNVSIPFIMEATGGFSVAAFKLISKLWLSMTIKADGWSKGKDT